MPQTMTGVRVLVVDDDPDVRDAVVAAFKSAGAQVEAVGDGNDAVDACQEDPPTVVILDMMLPGRSGFLALERIKGRDDSPYVVMITANEGKRHRAYATTLGIDGYFEKPVPLAALLEHVEGLVGGRAGGDHAPV